MKYLHNKFQILTRKIVSCLTYFQCTHILAAIWNDDVTGGGPMEAPIFELSVPALKLIQSHLV